VRLDTRQVWLGQGEVSMCDLLLSGFEDLMLPEDGEDD
jgi:hypothetical protein